MQSNYYIDDNEVKATSGTAADRLALIEQLMTSADSHLRPVSEDLGRNLLTRTVDAGFALVRKYALPFHWLGVSLSAFVLFVYARLVALTSRLTTTGEPAWPRVPGPSVLALWHKDAPSLLVAFARHRPTSPCVIMIAGDPRGDCLALLCRMVGFGVVRGSSEQGGWKALTELAGHLARGACVFITADGGGPARIAKVGAVALASAVRVPLIPLAADCHPAIEERHKWDTARNPLPFGNLTVLLGPARCFAPLEELSLIEEARSWLEVALNRASCAAVATLRSW